MSFALCCKDVPMLFSLYFLLTVSGPLVILNIHQPTYFILIQATNLDSSKMKTQM